MLDSDDLMPFCRLFLLVDIRLTLQYQDRYPFLVESIQVNGTFIGYDTDGLSFSFRLNDEKKETLRAMNLQILWKLLLDLDYSEFLLLLWHLTPTRSHEKPTKSNLRPARPALFSRASFSQQLIDYNRSLIIIRPPKHFLKTQIFQWWSTVQLDLLGSPVQVTMTI